MAGSKAEPKTRTSVELGALKAKGFGVLDKRDGGLHDHADAEQVAWITAGLTLNHLRRAVHSSAAHNVIPHLGRRLANVALRLTEIAEFQPQLAAGALLLLLAGRGG